MAKQKSNTNAKQKPLLTIAKAICFMSKAPMLQDHTQEGADDIADNLVLAADLFTSSYTDGLLTMPSRRGKAFSTK